jgi:toxin secretion/phage lysis holin
MDRIVQIVTSSICAICGFVFGGLDGLLKALIAFIAFDYISGLIVAIVKKELSSAVGFKGILKKVLILIIVGVGNILDVYVFNLGDKSVCRSAVIGFFLANEGISILENAGKLGIPLPKKLLDVLKQLKNKEDEE